MVFRKAEAFLVGLSISSFQPGNVPASFDSERTRKLLLKKNEISRLFGKTQTGLTVIPLRAYISNRNLVKIELGVGRRRKKRDKRDAIRKREVNREIRKETRRG